MRILNRHFARAIVVSTLIALFVLTSLSGFFAVIHEMNDIGKGTYGMADVLANVGLTMPRRAYDMFPMAALIGALMGLGVLADNRELVAVRAAGVSMAQIVLSVARAGLIMAVVGIVLLELTGPLGEQTAQKLKLRATDNQFTFKGQQGFWVRDGRQFVNIKTVLSDSEVRNMRILEFGADYQIVSIVDAASGHYFAGDDTSDTPGGDEQGWTLSDVTFTHFEGAGYTQTRHKTWHWQTGIDPDTLSVVAFDPEILTIWELGSYIDYLANNGLETQAHELALWGKLVAPFSIIVMVVLAVPFVFGSLRDSKAGVRILIGILVGISFFIADRTLGRMSVVFGFSPFLSAIAPTLVFALIAAVSVRRLR